MPKFRYKRIYFKGGAGVATLVTLFAILTMMGGQVTSPSGDFACTGDYRTQQQCSEEGLEFGTECGPCVSEVSVYNPTPKHWFVYNHEQFNITFSPNIPDHAFYVKDGRCSGKLTGSSCSCILNDGSEYAVKDYRCVDFTNRTKPRSDRLYVFRWYPYDRREHLLLGFKSNPNQKVKWTISSEQDVLDPAWEAVNQNFVNISFCKPKKVLSEKKAFKKVEKTRKVREKVRVCETVKTNRNNLTTKKNITEQDCKIQNKLVNKTFFVEIPTVVQNRKTVCVPDGNIYVGQKKVGTVPEGFSCSYNRSQGLVECDSKRDGNGDGACKQGGGETCVIKKFANTNKDVKVFSESRTNSEVPGIEGRTKSYEARRGGNK